MIEYVVAFDNPVRINCCSSDDITAEMGTSFMEYNLSIKEGSLVGGKKLNAEVICEGITTDSDDEGEATISEASVFSTDSALEIESDEE